MRKVEKKDYYRYADSINAGTPGAVYPLSVIEGIQSGDIYEDDTALLIWHIGGFAVVSGSCGKEALDFIYDLMTGSSDRRLVLFSNDSRIRDYFAGKPDTAIENRYFFDYRAPESIVTALPDGFVSEEINAADLNRIRGRVVPGTYWGDDGFLTKGKGFCITHGSDVVSWAFSAAVSSRELDIGVETDERFRGLGLAAAAASRLAEYALSQGKNPTWACHSENAASRRTAEKIGFVRSSGCMTIRKK